MDATSPNEADLIQRSRARDPEAFALLVDRYKDRIVGYSTRITGDRERAEEVAQETFVRLFQHLERFKDDGNLAAYLFRIATNLVRSEERKKRRWRLLVPHLSQNGHFPGPNQAREVLASEEQWQVSKALASLDVTFRAPLVMREIEGLSYGEIALILDTSEGTVKSRVHRAKNKLKKTLEPYWKGEN